jgi:hypothetical protein
VVSRVTRALEDPRERAQELAERWRERVSLLVDIGEVGQVGQCAFELAEAFGLDPEGAAHEPDPKPCATCDGRGTPEPTAQDGSAVAQADVSDPRSS